ncbi:hypothetical protein DENSPDRAFT_552718 [Dentipellis sp. KUC8613]|nr:hypothetical protein DENSPDRAFT_552718 [Dentipellis sp. KUC8613]
MRVVVGVAVRRGRWDGERERLYGAFGRQNQGVLDHRTRACVQVGVLDGLDSRVVRECRHSCVARFVVFHHVDGRLQGLLVDGRGERLRVVEANKNANVKKMVLRHAEVAQNRLLGRERERGGRGGEVDGGDELVDAGIEEGICWPVNSVDIRFRVALQVDELQTSYS